MYAQIAKTAFSVLSTSAVRTICAHKEEEHTIDHTSYTFDESSSKVPITAAEEGGKAQDRRRLALQIAKPLLRKEDDSFH